MLVLVLLVGMIIVSAPSAAADDLTDKAGWINLLDYYTVFDGSNFTAVYGHKYFGISVPFETNLYRVDMVLMVSGDPLSLVQVAWPNTGAESNLTMVDLGNGLVRVYGSMPAGNYRGFDIRLYSHGTSYVTFETLRVCTVSSTLTPETGYIYHNGSIRAEMGQPNSIATYLAYSDIGGFGGVDEVHFNVRGWRNYDAVEIAFEVSCETVVGVYAGVGEYKLPVELTYLGNADETYSNYFAVATVDLSGVPRDLAHDLSLRVLCDLESTQFSMSLHLVNGITYIEPPSPLRYWFTNLFGNLSTWFTNLINTVNTGFSNVGTWLSSGFQSVVNKLDELINGSSDGTSEQIKDDLGSVGDFEDRYHNTVEGNWGDVSGSLDQVVGGSNFIGAASFYSDIVQTIFESVPDYGVVLTAVLCVFVVFSLL